MLIALGLFALIGVAGLTLLDGVLRAQERTDGRLARLGELERAMHLVTLDLEQADPATLAFDAGTLAFRTQGRRISYVLRDGSLERAQAGSRPGDGVAQSLIADVASVEWAFYERGAGWRDGWPADAEEPPDAVSLTVALGDALPGLRGAVRRVAELAEPPPPDPLGGLGL
jgi:general secretion pathway protein J